MAGKVSDEDMFRLEKRIKKAEAIIACMTEEERTVPDLLARQVSAFTKMSKGFLLSIAQLCPTYLRISSVAISGMYLLFA
jgi:signal recognition particle GTPase